MKEIKLTYMNYSILEEALSLYVERKEKLYSSDYSQLPKCELINDVISSALSSFICDYKKKDV